MRTLFLILGGLIFGGLVYAGLAQMGITGEASLEEPTGPVFHSVVIDSPDGSETTINCVATAKVSVIGDSVVEILYDDSQVSPRVGEKIANLSPSSEAPREDVGAEEIESARNAGQPMLVHRSSDGSLRAGCHPDSEVVVSTPSVR